MGHSALHVPGARWNPCLQGTYVVRRMPVDNHRHSLAMHVANKIKTNCHVTVGLEQSPLFTPPLSDKGPTETKWHHVLKGGTIDVG